MNHLVNFSLAGVTPSYVNIMDAVVVNGQLVLTAGIQVGDPNASDNRGLKWIGSWVMPMEVALNLATGIQRGAAQMQQAHQMMQTEVAGHG